MKNFTIEKHTFILVCFTRRRISLILAIFLFMGVFLEATAKDTLSEPILPNKTINNNPKQEVPVALNFEEPEMESIQQQNRINGTITDESGAPIPGVSIAVEETTQGAITDLNGNYSIEIPQGATTLIFSFVGMETQRISIGNQSRIDLVMKSALIGLDDVVVIGYGTQKKYMVTGSISEIKSDKLVTAPLPNVTQTLAGRLPGLVSKQTQGAPGLDDATLSIRGYGPPLVIVDGVEGNFNRLNPNEVESVTILKDAAAAIYGSRAGNGVILVTTKRGKDGKPAINFNYAYSLQTNTRFLKPLSSGQFTELVNEWTEQRGAGSNPYTQEDIDKYYAGNDPDYPSTDWFEAVTRKSSPMKEYNLSVSGGNDRVNYYSFFGILDQQSFFSSNDGNYKRYNVRINLDAKITDNLTAYVDLSSYIGVRKFPERAGDLHGAFFQSVWACLPIYPSELPDPDKYPYTGSISNVVAESDREGNGYHDNNNTNIKGSLALVYTVPFLKGLSLKAFGNFTKDFNFDKRYNRRFLQYEYDYENQSYIERASASGSLLDHIDYQNQEITGQFSINFDRVFGDHRIGVLALYELIDYYSNTVTAHRGDFLNPDFDYLFGGSQLGMGSNGFATEMGRASYVGRFNYAFKDKYLLDATIRHDASAKFPAESRWGTFPSLSLGWRLSEEDFIANGVPGINNLKLRGGYSQTGNDAIGNFQYLSGYIYGAGMAFGSATQIALASLGLANPLLTWETLNISNIGLDFGIGNDVLYGSFDVFKRLRDGIAGKRNTSLPTTFGDVAPLENINSMTSQGFEVLLGTRSNVGEFKFDISANISYNRAKWLHFDEADYTDPDDIRLNQKTGNYVDRTIGYVSLGLFTSQEQIDALDFDADGAGNSTLSPGDINFKNTNGDDILDWRDQEVIGNGGTPHWMLGTNINATYKSFDLSVLFQGAWGYSVYNALNPGLDQDKMPNASTALYENRWTEDNNDPNALVAKIGSTANNRRYYTDHYLKDGAYVRLKVLSIGYNLPNRWLNPAGISALRVYFAGTNLFTLDKLKVYGVDPEAPAAWSNSSEVAEATLTSMYNIQPNARNGAYYPQQKTFSLGVNLTF